MSGFEQDEPDIPAALDAEAWRKGPVYSSAGKAAATFGADPNKCLRLSLEGRVYVTHDPSDISALIALANAALHDEDPRKFRREHVDMLRAAAHAVEAEREHTDDAVLFDRMNDLHELADVIESYLPPMTVPDGA